MLNTKISQSTAKIFPNHADLIQILADEIVSDCEQHLPFLENTIVLFPHYLQAKRFQKILLEQTKKRSYNSLIGPQIYTFKEFITKTTPINSQSIASSTRELILLDALQSHQKLFGKHNLLTSTYALLELFDELTQNQVSLPSSFEEFKAQLEKAYQIKGTDNQSLSSEAHIVHTLWYAWHQQLNDSNRIDGETQYQLQLSKNAHSKSNNFYYIAGYYDFTPSEAKWINHQIQQNQAKLFLQATPNEQSDYVKKLVTDFSNATVKQSPVKNFSAFVQLVFENQQLHLQQRAARARTELHPISASLTIFRANSFEEEAKAITTQIRIWLSENITAIGLILEDRQLARRVRALLQRHGIGMIDHAGWALSTTAAASVIENWLQCIEENFHYMPLLNILKSPFSFQQTEAHCKLIYRLEQDLIFHENISSDLQRFQHACEYRQNRLNIVNSENSKQLIQLFKHLSNSARPLQDCHQATVKPARVYIDSLITSLEQLGAYHLLNLDEAGNKIIVLLENLRLLLLDNDASMDWVTFRHWFSLKLEENNFSPHFKLDPSIEMISLSQSALAKYDGIIIGSMTREQFPGNVTSTPFFNQSVRHELGLPSAKLRQEINYQRFRASLESAPNILLTYHTGPQESLASPWLELLAQFHLLAFDQSLENSHLHHIINKSPKIHLEKDADSRHSSATISDKNLLPASISASAHETLIQCPYAFFAGQILGLQVSEDIKEKLAKSDYGERIHLCLYAFHAGGVKNISGPFHKMLSDSNKQEAINLLVKISQQIFAADLEDNFQHRGWLKRWQKIIPEYIEWQLLHEQEWQFKTGEIKTKAVLSPEVSVHGRIDRLDQSLQAFNIIDYKTGNVPRPIDVEMGEAVQLAHYALASTEMTDDTQKVSKVTYLEFESNTKPVAEKCYIEKDTLEQLKVDTKKRLLTIYNSLLEGAEMPASGAENICSYCQFSGLCRHKFQ